MKSYLQVPGWPALLSCAQYTYWHIVVFNVVSGYGIQRVLGDFTSVVMQACGKWPAHRALNTLFAISWDMCDRLLYILIVTLEHTAGDSPRILSLAWLTIYRNYFKEVWQSMRFLSLCPRRFYYTTFANGVTWQSVGFPPTPSLRMQLGTGGMSLSHPFHLIADSHTGFDMLFWPACIGRYWDLEIDTQTFNGNHIRSFLQKEWLHDGFMFLHVGMLGSLDGEYRRTLRQVFEVVTYSLFFPAGVEKQVGWVRNHLGH